jgi:hypothetical protein
MILEFFPDPSLETSKQAGREIQVWLAERRIWSEPRHRSHADEEKGEREEREKRRKAPVGIVF